MNFTQAIKEATIKVLKMSKKNLLFGLEVTNHGSGYSDINPKQVYETPVSELSTSGLVVGLASRGFRPLIVFGRVEFALLALDQILTQAGRWQYMFGKKYFCPAKFRIQIGRQWGNGPQHTANYHSIFLQSTEIDVFIPSTPSEAYAQVIYMNHIKRPSVMLEHRYLSLISENFKIPKIVKEISDSTIYISKRKQFNILIVTYADTLINALIAKKILEKNNIYVTIINFSYFPAHRRINDNLFKFINRFKNILFIDSAPYEFGLLSGIQSLISVRVKNINFFYLAPPSKPAPSSPTHMKDYYINKTQIINKVCSILKKKKITNKKMSFEELVLWPNINIRDYF